MVCWFTGCSSEITFSGLVERPGIYPHLNRLGRTTVGIGEEEGAIFLRVMLQSPQKTEYTRRLKKRRWGASPNSVTGSVFSGPSGDGRADPPVGACGGSRRLLRTRGAEHSCSAKVLNNLTKGLFITLKQARGVTLNNRAVPSSWHPTDLHLPSRAAVGGAILGQSLSGWRGSLLN